MKIAFLAVIVFFTVSCGSGDKSSESSDNAKSDTAVPGNSGGSNITGMDTARMDTSMQTAPASH